MDSSEWLKIGTMVQNANLVDAFSWSIFLEKRGKPWNFLKNFSHIGVSYKFVFKSAKSLNWIFWVIEYWCKAQKCNVGSMNAKTFPGKTRQTFSLYWKISPYIGIFYKFVLKSPKSLNRIIWMIEYWYKAPKCKFSWQMQNNFSRKTKQTLKVSEEYLLPY